MIAVVIGLMGCPGVSADTFADVPKDHWATESVQKVVDAGILQGYPDNTFRGDKNVTRYELAVALERFVEFIRGSQKPLVKSEQSLSVVPRKIAESRRVGESESGEWRAKASCTILQKHWAEKSMHFLKVEGFLPKNSILLTNGDAPITHVYLADTLAAVAARLIELRVPAEN